MNDTEPSAPAFEDGPEEERPSPFPNAEIRLGYPIVLFRCQSCGGVGGTENTKALPKRWASIEVNTPSRAGLVTIPSITHYCGPCWQIVQLTVSDLIGAK